MGEKHKIAIIGPAHPLRGGGLTTFNHRMAREFMAHGDECGIYSFSLQYPSFLFPGTSQYTKEPAPAHLVIHSVINSINPINWVQVGRRLAKEKPDIVIVRFWIPFMGPALGTILRLVKRNRPTKIICLADNVRPHVGRLGDKSLTKYFLGSCHAFITMSEKVMKDLRSLEKSKPAMIIPHPIYDNFGERMSKSSARERLKIGPADKVILFFGFIRKYKGLDILLAAMADERIRKASIRLLIAGEFYEDERWYQDLIDQLDIRSQLLLHTSFIKDIDVPYFFCASDVVVQPYRNATQSGVTPLAYHFEKPMIVTNVGGLPDLVPHEKVGLIASPDPKSIADSILRFFEMGEDFFIPHLRMEKQKYSWSNLVEKIYELAGSIKM